jgi:predicted SAM-dependent methyltransferase/glycosyltransferase involved in cell wall biosynthesis
MLPSTTKAPLSACLISRRTPHLDACLASFADYVSEICIVCNDPDDHETARIAKKYGAKLEYFTACNDEEGRIADFSMARNRSLEMATQPFTLWIDDDDLLRGAEKLADYCAIIELQSFFYLPYEYSYDQNKRVTCRLWRERIWRTGEMKFVGPIHEVAIPQGDKTFKPIFNSDIVYSHQRQFINDKPIDHQRNLRILKKFMAENPTDVRNKFYIGLEYFNVNNLDAAKDYLTKYVSETGWADEKWQAETKLMEIAERQNQADEALNWAYQTLRTQPWFESYYNLCRLYYFRNDWTRCAHFGQVAINQPPTNTPLFLSDLARFDIHQYLNVALNHLGQLPEALQSVEAGLVGLPENSYLLNNKRHYLRALNPAQQEPEPSFNPQRLEIIFVAGPSYEPWTPETVERTGIGGSETMMIKMARGLAKRGHRVRVYAAGSGTFDGVEYHPLEEFDEKKCDVLIVSRYAPYLADHYCQARLKYLWLHDICAVNGSNEMFLKADKILCLSHWHKQNVMGVHNLPSEHIRVTRNGIDLHKCHQLHRNPHRAINASSPDRSWPVLLTVWPRIKEQVPDAELHLYYGFANWKKMAVNDPAQMALIQRLEEQVQNTPGVIYHGRVNESELSEAYCKSGAMLYPTFFTETSCLNQMMSDAAGCHSVVSNIAALKETMHQDPEKGYRVKLDGEWTSPEYQDQFVKYAVEALTTDKERLYSTHYDINSLVADWNAAFLKDHELKRTHPLPPYQPTPPYQNLHKAVPMTKLNLCCGPNIFPYDGWVNVDHFDFTDYIQNYLATADPAHMVPHQQGIAHFLRRGGSGQFIKASAVEPLTMFSDNMFEFIYLGQAVEHFHFETQVPALLKECLRILKPGGIIRITTPDINKLLVAYQMHDMDRFNDEQPPIYKTLDRAGQLAMLIFGSFGPNCTQTNYEGHFFNYTEKSLTRQLEEAGFKEIESTWPRCGKNKTIALEVRDEGYSHSMIVEAVK